MWLEHGSTCICTNKQIKSHNLCFFHVYKKIRSPLYHYFLHWYYRFTSVSIFNTQILYALSIPMYFDRYFLKTLTSFDFFIGGGGREGRGVCKITSYLGAITNTQYMYLSKMHNFSSNVPEIFVTNILESSS